MAKVIRPTDLELQFFRWCVQKELELDIGAGYENLLRRLETKLAAAATDGEAVPGASLVRLVAP